jgi:hypothetical protein
MVLKNRTGRIDRWTVNSKVRSDTPDFLRRRKIAAACRTKEAAATKDRQPEKGTKRGGL